MHEYSYLGKAKHSLSQSFDVVMQAPDLEVILASEVLTVATRPFVHLCYSFVLQLSLYLSILYLWNHPLLIKYLLVLERNTFHQFLVILFWNHSFHAITHTNRPELYNSLSPSLLQIWIMSIDCVKIIY